MLTWAVYAAGLGETINASNILVRKHEGKRLLGRPRPR